MRLLIVAIVLTLLASACGTSESTESSSAPSTYAPRTTTAPTSTAPLVLSIVEDPRATAAPFFSDQIIYESARAIDHTLNWLYWVESTKYWDPTPPDTFDAAFLSMARAYIGLTTSIVKYEPEVAMEEAAIEFRDKVKSGVTEYYEPAAKFLIFFLISLVHERGTVQGMHTFLNMAGTSGILYLNPTNHVINRTHKSLILGDPHIYQNLRELELWTCGFLVAEYCPDG